MPKNRIEAFVTQVRATLNLHLFCTTVICAMAIGAASMVIIGLVYVFQGLAVPRVLYAFALGLTSTVAVGIWLLRRISKSVASEFADKFFGLKDSVTAYRHFTRDGKTGGYFDLQAQQTHARVDRLPSTAIPYTWPTKTMSIALVLGFAAILLAFRGPSQRVLDRLAIQAATLEQTAAMNQQLEELVKEIEKELTDDQERKLAQPEKLREWVRELRETNDQKAALRQYAKLEQKLRSVSSRVQQKRDEQFLERAASELEKGEESRRLAKPLKQKKYDEAAKELKKMQPMASKPLTEKRKQIAKLQAAVKRMTSAAQSSMHRADNKEKAKPSSDQRREGNRSKDSQLARPTKSEGQTEASTAQEAQGEQERASAEQLVQELDQALDQLRGQIERAAQQGDGEGEQEKGQALLGQLQEGQADTETAMSKLAAKLTEMGVKKRLQSKLATLSKACSQCQSQSADLANSAGVGGKQAGWGSDNTQRSERDALVDNGQYTQLKGTKGEGPSLISIEAAEDGTGVSTSRRVPVNRTFKRQMESFVEREDVPDDVKSGVRNYFEMIHQSE